MEGSYRDRRVAELLRQEVANIINREVKDPRVHDVVITGVDVAKDLANAKIHYTSYTGDINAIGKGLAASAKFIKGRLVKALTIRRVPDLTFVQDTSAEYGSHIDKLLRDMNRE